MLLLLPILFGVISLFVVWYVFHTYGFQRGCRYIFVYGIVAIFLFPWISIVIEPSLNEGMGIGFLYVMLLGPILVLLGVVNIGIIVYNYFNREKFPSQDADLSPVSPTGKVIKIAIFTIVAIIFLIFILPITLELTGIVDL